MSKEALQIAEERKGVKVNGERERYIQWNAEFQRIAKRDKRAFFFLDIVFNLNLFILRG